MKRPIYLDYSATTPVDPRVAEAMMNCLRVEGNFGNPASRSHFYGWQAEEAVEDARGHVAALVNADTREIVWTSGATESNNLAIKGVAGFYKSKGKHIVTSKIEHKAVLDACRQLEREGFEVTYLDPEAGTGLIHPAAVEAVLRDDTLLVSLMHVNNEIGTITDIAAIGEITRARGILFHVDAAQSTGKIDIDRIATGVGASQRNNILIVKEILNDLEARSGKTISIEDVVQEARTRGLDSEKVEEAIEKLRRTGDIFEPRRGFISKL